MFEVIYIKKMIEDFKICVIREILSIGFFMMESLILEIFYLSK